ncbi:hypothetical protein SAMN05444165_6691 [Paraburkholderia phenazinium]|uniref:Uncharacterized protein n=1 Tax=Paraburkholderia phenazinium TaxID=60549 RepID=A0A1N6L8R4_9BURK|nr:hypothetical protein SAMN05444165_6691 [Paraburkholderia phenazinium]
MFFCLSVLFALAGSAFLGKPVRDARSAEWDE